LFCTPDAHVGGSWQHGGEGVQRNVVGEVKWRDLDNGVWYGGVDERHQEELAGADKSGG